MLCEYMVNVNIEIPDELHKKLKLAAVMDGKTMKTIITDVLSDVKEK